MPIPVPVVPVRSLCLFYVASVVSAYTLLVLYLWEARCYSWGLSPTSPLWCVVGIISTFGLPPGRITCNLGELGHGSGLCIKCVYTRASRSRN